MHNALFSNNMLQANAYTHRCSIFLCKCCANVLRIWEYATYACAWLENNTFHIFSLTALENMKKQKFRPALLHLSPDLSHHLRSTQPQLRLASLCQKAWAQPGSPGPTLRLSARYMYIHVYMRVHIVSYTETPRSATYISPTKGIQKTMLPSRSFFRFCPWIVLGYGQGFLYVAQASTRTHICCTEAAEHVKKHSARTTWCEHMFGTHHLSMFNLVIRNEHL